MKTISKMLLILLSVLATSILILVIVLLIYSPGNPKPFLANEGAPIEGSVSEKTFVRIGGVRPIFFHGIYDYTVASPLAKKHLEELHAPAKGFYTFENSAHSPIFEEPQRVREIFENDILKVRNEK